MKTNTLPTIDPCQLEAVTGGIKYIPGVPFPRTPKRPKPRRPRGGRPT